MTGRPSFQRQLEELQRDMVAMGTRVEEVIQQAVTALLDRDQETARQIIAGDDYFDQRELELERRCLSLVALQQPVASDLRLLGAALKIITDLERMADHAQAIAKSTLRLGTEPFIKPLIDIPLMARLARGMVHGAITAYISQNEALARQMIARDEELDRLYKQVFHDLLEFMVEDRRTIPQATQLLFIAAHLERIGDHATNIGEWVIYMITGVRSLMNN